MEKIVTQLGSCLGVLCIAHCLTVIAIVVTMLLGVLSFDEELLHLLDSSGLHATLAAITLSLAFVEFYLLRDREKRKNALYILALAVFCIVSSLFFGVLLPHGVHSASSHVVSHLLFVCGSIALLTVHQINRSAAHR